MNTLSKIGIFTLLLVSSLTIMVGSAIAPALSGISENINIDFPPRLLITLPSLGVIVFAPIIGKLTNKLGTFKLMCFGLIPYAVLGVLGAYLSNQYVLIVDRFLLGAATVAIQVSVTGMIASLFSGESRMKIIAWQGMAIELGGVVFLSIGGVLGEWHWQGPFYIYLIAIICLILVYYTLPKPAVAEEKTDNTSEKAQVSPKAKRRVLLIFMGSLFAMILFFIAFVTLPIYLDLVFNFTESITGYYMAFISVMAILTASQMPKVAKKFGDGSIVSFGFLFFALGYVFFALAGSILFLGIAAVLLGIGFGLTVPLLNHMMIEASTPQTMGKNLGLYSMGIFGGQFLSTFVGFITDDYTILFAIASGLGVFVLVLLFFSFRANNKLKASENLT